ncbi:MAG: rhodanese-like domain-containing protein [Egibacteraceae bacterium]
MPREIHTPADVLRLREAGAQLVEVLPREEFEDAHLPAATHLSLRRLDAEAKERLDIDRPVVVYCWDSA